MRRTSSRVAMLGALVSLGAFAAQEVDARGGRGGGLGGGGGGGVNRGGKTSLGGGSGTGGGGFSRGGSYSRPSGGSVSQPTNRAGNAGRGGSVNAGNVNRGSINSGNVNRANINTGNINTGDVNINVDNDYRGGWNGYGDYPLAAGVAIGATAAWATAVAYGSAYRALPPACAPYPYNNYTFYSCGGAWYQPQYEGDVVVYVSVPDPTK